MDSTPGGSNSEEIYINRLTLVGYYRECGLRNDSDRMQHLHKKVENALKMSYLSTDTKNILSKLINSYKGKLQMSHRNFERCVSAHKDWFDQYVCFTVATNQASKKKSESHGRGRRPPNKDFQSCAERTKRQKTEQVRMQSTPSELAYAAQMQYRVYGDIEKSKLIKDISLHGDVVPRVPKTQHDRLSSDKALSMVIEGNLTKHQYNTLRSTALEVNCNLYPNYESITEAKKKCYPLGVLCTETKAEVPLQSLIDHTTQRLLLSLTEVIQSLAENDKPHLQLIWKWGCDGSGSHSQYKQRFEDTECSDEYMFITSLVPVRLLCIALEKPVLIWQNPRPSSTRYCRPLRLQMAHETAEISKLEAANVQQQISQLIPTTTEEWRVMHDLKLTMVDGKMVNALTETSSAMRCYLCGLTSKDFNKLKMCVNAAVKEENFAYGISSLHAWIRLAECVLHLAYKLKTGKWQARSARDKEIVATEKKRIQKEYWEKLGLHVDKPRQGGGTSTDGNTARILFQHAEETANITGVSLNIINRFHSILKLLSSGYRINIQKFNTYCLKTASVFIFNYPWFNMPTTVHKILIHGSHIVQNMGIAIGLFGEDAQESRNKDVRKYREQYARKFSRRLAMEDTFLRLMVSSDPYITGLRKLVPRKQMVLNHTEISLLDDNLE